MDDLYKKLAKTLPKIKVNDLPNFHSKLSPETVTRLTKIGGITKLSPETAAKLTKLIGGFPNEQLLKELSGCGGMPSPHTVLTKAPEPTKKPVKRGRGRPLGTGFHKEDEPAVAKAIQLLDSGMAQSIADAVRQVTDKKLGVSQLKRLERRVSARRG